jgi:hypothetical protein
MWPSVCHGNSLAFKMAPCHFKMAPPPISQFYSFKLEFGDRWAESMDKLCKKNENLRMEKTKETLYDDTWDQEINTQSICDRFYNPSNSPWDIWSTSSVGHTPAQFWGDRNRDWNNFTKITQGRPSFFRQKENTRKMEVYLLVIVDPANSCEVFGKTLPIDCFSCLRSHHLLDCNRDWNNSPKSPRTPFLFFKQRKHKENGSLPSRL